jgi:hypothetical protein
MRWITGLFGFALAMSTFASPAMSGSHLWRFSEFYSSPDRSVQFIEMAENFGADNETQILAHWFETDSYNSDHSEILGANLVGSTAHKKFLVGSVSYAALPGVPAPDYIIPDGAINPAGDTIVWWFYQTIVIPPGVMPSDGVMSITVDDPLVPSYTVGVNSPTNFAGETGIINEPPPPPPTPIPMSSPQAIVGIAAISAVLGVVALRRGRPRA